MRELAEALRADIDAAVRQLRAVSDGEAIVSRGEGKWIRKEILGHLIDSAVNNHQRFVRAQFANPFVWPGYDQNMWVAVNGYRDRPWAELIDLWYSLNRQLAHVIEMVPESKLATTCTIGEHTGTLEWWMRDYVRHLRHHLAQLAAT